MKLEQCIRERNKNFFHCRSSTSLGAAHMRTSVLMLLVVGGHIANYWVVAGLSGNPEGFRLSLYNWVFPLMLALAIAVFLVGYLLYIITIVRPERPFALVKHHARDELQLLPRIAIGMPAMVAVTLSLSAYSQWKILIPEVSPFSWDATFWQWDRFLHFGQDPWHLLQPVFGGPSATLAVNAVYHAWFFVIYLTLFWQAFSLRNPLQRGQFLLSFFLSWWFLGNVGATLFSSVGPCYYGFVVPGPDPYEPLMNALSYINTQVPVWALDVQHSLWQSHQEAAVRPGHGISAMPSMHVATSTLVALLAARGGRVWAVLGYSFLATIMVGSVHLGWHYAVDSYAGLVGALVCWKLSQLILQQGGLVNCGTERDPLPTSGRDHGAERF